MRATIEYDGVKKQEFQQLSKHLAVDRRVVSGCRLSAVCQPLPKTLIKDSEIAGIWTLEAATFPGNKSSIALLKSRGFCQVGYRERLGRLQGIWRDVIVLERRRKVAGT